MSGVGTRFRPTQQELIWLLQCKAKGEEISKHTNDVLEKDLYGNEADKEPWNVFSDVADHRWELYDESNNNPKRVVYVLTKVSQMSARKKNRSSGRGTWNGETAPKPVLDCGKIVGYYKQLTYVVKSKTAAAGSGEVSWYMHEYSLSKQSLEEARIESTDYVICRVIRDDSKSGKKKISVKTGDRKRKTVCGEEVADLEEGINLQTPCGSSNNIAYQEYSSGKPLESVRFSRQGEFQNNDRLDDERIPNPGYNQAVETQVVHQEEEAESHVMNNQQSWSTTTSININCQGGVVGGGSDVGVPPLIDDPGMYFRSEDIHDQAADSRGLMEQLPNNEYPCGIDDQAVVPAMFDDDDQETTELINLYLASEDVPGIITEFNNIGYSVNQQMPLDIDHQEAIPPAVENQWMSYSGGHNQGADFRGEEEMVNSYLVT